MRPRATSGYALEVIIAELARKFADDGVDLFGGAANAGILRKPSELIRIRTSSPSELTRELLTELASRSLSQ